MSSLWNGKNTKQLKTSHKRPSPKKNNSNQSLAQGFTSSSDRNIIYKQIKCRTIKGTSLFTFLGRSVKAGMTVEAAMVLPIFLFFFLNLSCAIEIIRLHGNLQVAMCEVGSELSVYGYALSNQLDANETELGQVESSQTETNETVQSQIGGILFSYGYVKNQMVNYLGEDYLEESPLTYGADGLQFLESSIFRTDDIFDVVATYAVSPWSSCAGFYSFRMVNRYYGHIWNGYSIPLSEDAKMQSTVYITESGEVFHEDRNCSHLNLTISEITLKEVASYRNEQGEKYEVCQKCCEAEPGVKIYITKEGNRYHYKRDCPSIKRTVFSMLKGEAIEKNYRSCKRCGKS